MTAGGRIAGFGMALLAIFALALLAGRAAGPAADDGEAPGHEARSGHDETGHAAAGAHTEGADAGASAGGAGAHAADGERLRIAADPATTRRPPGVARPLRFRIVDATGATVRDFETSHERELHLVVVRRDLRRFQHLHPRRDARGVWSLSLRLPDAGVYHAFAEFVSAGARHVAGIDLFAGGRFEPLALPPARESATTGTYAVTLAGRDDGELRFAVRRDGAPVEDLQPYLGARGHLVMLRTGDLAYEHVHALRDDALAFDASAVPAGTYRMFLQFRHRGAVRTVAFTREVSP